MVSFLRFGASLIHRDWWRRRTLEISPSTAVDLEYGLPLAVRDARRRRMDFQPAGDDENVLILIKNPRAGKVAKILYNFFQHNTATRRVGEEKEVGRSRSLLVS